MQENLKILISSRSFGKIDSGAIELLKKSGLTPVINPYGKKLSEDELIPLVQDVTGIIAGTEEISEKVLSSAKDLKVISRYGVGLDNVNLQCAQNQNVLVYCTPETPSLAVAELTISLILNLLRKISILDSKIKNSSWKQEVGNLLSGKTVGVIGIGRIGKKVISLLKPFNVKILAYDICPDNNFTSKNKIELIEFETLLKNSDIITLHCPPSEKSEYLIGKNQLSLMKKNAILINTARGTLVNENDLYDSLKNKQIAGAAVDVFENEPYAGPLKELENVILTPHIGSLTVETRKQMEIEAVENLISGLKKQHII